MKELLERYELLAKEVEYISKFLPDWEGVDLPHLLMIIREMEAIQFELKLLYKNVDHD